MIATERARPDVAERRKNFAIARRFVDPKHLVFLDESGAQTHMTRRYGRAEGGARCVDSTPYRHWQTMTMLSAIRHEGVMEQASVVFDGSIDGPTFESYVEECLAPALRPGDVVVMDNLPAHKMPSVRRAIEAVGCDLWYLPPYSPDFNPIEQLWSKVKSWLRRVGAGTFQTVSQAVGDALRDVKATECPNYLAACGY